LEKGRRGIRGKSKEGKRGMERRKEGDEREKRDET